MRMLGSERTVLNFLLFFFCGLNCRKEDTEAKQRWRSSESLESWWDFLRLRTSRLKCTFKRGAPVYRQKGKNYSVKSEDVWVERLCLFPVASIKFRIQALFHALVHL